MKFTTLFKAISTLSLALSMTGCVGQTRAEQDSRITALEKTGITIQVKESAYKYSDGLDEILDQMEDVEKNDAYLYKTVKKVVLCTNPLKASGQKGDYRIKGGTYAGHADSKNRVIYINVKEHSETTVKHELFHEFDSYFDKTRNLSESDEFLEAGNKYYTKIMRIFDYDTIQGEGNVHEFFVNLCIDYTEKKDSKIIREQFPEIYEFIERYVEELMGGVCRADID